MIDDCKHKSFEIQEEHHWHIRRIDQVQIYTEECTDERNLDRLIFANHTEHISDFC